MNDKFIEHLNIEYDKSSIKRFQVEKIYMIKSHDNEFKAEFVNDRV